jgi:DMSO/TMAO reductase YedYZ molybdopterin-dependent catalytic subunit
MANEKRTALSGGFGAGVGAAAAGTRGAALAGGFGAGVGAALVMMLVMAVLRFTTNTASIPEIMEQPLLHLLPGEIESWFINTLGVGGKALLLVCIIEGTLLLGGGLGLLFARVWPTTVAVANWRWLSGVLYGLMIGAVLGLVFLPLMNQGVLGLNPAPDAIRVTAPPNISTAIYGTELSPITVPLWLAMLVLGLSFGLALVALIRWPQAAAVAVPAPVVPTGRAMDRREFMRALGGTALAVAGGAVLWAGFKAALAPPPVAGPTELIEEPAAAGPQGAPTTAAQAVNPPTSGAATPAPPTVAAEVPTPADGGPTSVPPTAEMAEVPPTPAATPAPTSAAFAGVKPVLVPEITPNDSFYITTKNFIDPTVDGNSWQITFKGLVENPFTLTLKDVQALPAINRVQTLACISNEVGGDLIGNTKWKGVSFRDLLLRAKPQDVVVDVIVRGADGYTDSFPISVAMDNEVVLAYEMNGGPLPQRHGYPARLLVPGIYGMKNCKWITEVELVSSDYKGYWEGQGWSDTAIYQTMSRIDYPNSRNVEAKPLYIGGVAFAGNRGIQRVEVSTDNGQTWNDATLRPALGKYTWVLWTYPWQPVKGEYSLVVRATDGTGAVQTADKNPTYPDGATGYHYRQVRVN